MRDRFYWVMVWIMGCFSLLHPAIALAQTHHSQADVWLEHDAYQPGMKIGLYIELEPQWHTYWLHAGDTGMPPVMDITASADIAVNLSELVAPAPKRFSTATSESFGYDQTVLFYRTLDLPDPLPADAFPLSLTVDAAWLVCKEICIPNQQSFNVKLLAPLGSEPSSTSAAIFDAYVYPQDPPITWQTRTQEQATTLIFNQLSRKDGVDFFPYNTTSRAWLRPSQVVHNVETTAFEFPTTQSLQQGLWVQYNTKGEPQSAHWAYPAGQAPSAGENASNWSIWTLLVLAFAGGLLLNAMPCVFPVLSLKAMSLLTERRPTNTSWFHTTAYSLGTMTTMVGLGLLVVVLQQTGQAVGWGFQLQSPGFVLNLMVLFTLLAVAFWGRIDIPGLQIHGRLGQRMHQPSPWGDFFTGALIVGVATPCTAPFMGVAMGVALTQSPWVIVLTFASLGLGLAFPFLLLHLFPRLTHFLPKPGMWMDRASKILALPLALSVIWLAWVLQNLTHPWMSWLALGTCVTMACCFFWRHFRSFSRIVLLAAAFWGLAWGLMHALELGTTNATTVVHDDRWQPYTAQAITDGLANNQPVFVDFTADWCLTCKVNERLTFTQDRVWQTVKEKNILMLKADWTRRDPAITQALKKLDRIGVPVYALWLPGQTKPILLPSVLTAGVFLEAIEKNL